MKYKNRRGTTFLFLGIFILFRKVENYCGFGGCYDNSFEILFSSSVVTIFGNWFNFSLLKNLKAIYFKVTIYRISCY